MKKLVLVQQVSSAYREFELTVPNGFDPNTLEEPVDFHELLSKRKYKTDEFDWDDEEWYWRLEDE